MNKKPRPLMKSSLASGEPEQPVSAISGENSVTSITATHPKPQPAVDKLTVYVPRAASKRLKQMALDHDKRVNDFLCEGVNLMLAKYGEPSLEDFEK
ncbi:ribbon-helix-helix domain-containing protein [Terrihabitans rhizophilus]|uniref:Ribbon-helix-helix domain-containing protein n=1 Tax=Terrihabitans rhizophilus TaxID=3092662 RepID=A0ABU4RRC8_9HYPH|nr:ribbon-helix-helix domain-containing protein [Terrihabitans sp. PJ23]MDX6807161.1 ribbon-helix-helix domain-containing protein [Terrihabitans sp. PJ23]